MITYLRGTLEKKSPNRAIIDVNGIGYEVSIPQSTFEKLPACGKEIKLSIVESVSMYGGNTALYGFLSEEEKEIYLMLKDEIPGTGAKKSLDYLEKISKSLPDFKRAIVKKDVSLLTGVFGFTKKTAEKIVSALKDKIQDVEISGKEKWAQNIESSSQSEAIAGLIALGYKEVKSREAVEKVLASQQKDMPVEHIIRQALGYL